MFARLSLVFVIGITYLGAFSRFTHGKWTPAFHRYQVDRAPDDESTRFVPFVDLIVATLLIFTHTRTVAALMGAIFQGFGIALRIKAGKPLLTDLALASAAVFVAWSSYSGNL